MLFEVFMSSTVFYLRLCISLYQFVCCIPSKRLNILPVVMLHKCIGSMSYKEQYWEHFACSVSKKESKEKVADMLMPEIIGYKVKEQVHNQEHD